MEVTGPRKVHNEAALERELERLYQRWGGLGFWAKRLHQKFTPGRAKYVGGIAAVRHVLKSPTSGLAFLREHDAMDQSVEKLILRPEWKDLFSDEDRVIARRRLKVH